MEIVAVAVAADHAKITTTAKSGSISNRTTSSISNTSRRKRELALPVLSSACGSFKIVGTTLLVTLLVVAQLT